MGRKRVNINPIHHRKCVERYKDNDRISWLPDEVLVLILSRLPLKEAGRTSVLSSRWINLWKYILCLNFDAESELENLARNWKQKKLRHAERCKYINWVNSVIRLHKGLTLEEFRVCFDLDKSSHKAITHWLECAFAKKVERLELELYEYGAFHRCGCETYVFPVNLLSRMSGGTSTVQRQPRAPLDVKALKALCLRCVKVKDEVIDFFLSNCPLLEQLIVYDSPTLINPKVCGSSLMLKHLEICDCYYIDSIKVSAPNLTSIKLTCVEGLLLENVPKLVNVYIHSVYGNQFVPTLLGIPQLEILTVELSLDTDANKVWKFPEVNKLTKLELIYRAKSDESLLGLTSFIEASPYLQEFVFKMEWGKQVSRTNKVNKRFSQFRHQHLKVFKFSGYYGRPGDIELIWYMLQCCVALEKIIIDPHYQKISFSRAPLEPDELVAERTARIYAERLVVEVPRRVELVIL